MKEELFNRLGMCDTYVLDMQQPKDPLRATGYKYKRNEILISEDDMPITGDGSIISSLHDLVVWYYPPPPPEIH